MKKYDYRKIFAVLLCLFTICAVFVGCTGQVTRASYANLENLELSKEQNPLYFEAYEKYLDGKEASDELKEEFLLEKGYIEVVEKDKDGDPSKIVYKPADLDEDGKIDLLVEENQYVGKEEKADKGFTYYILSPVGKMLAIVNDFLGSYILSLFVFAVLVKVLLFWFSYKQQKSMVKQAYFKPKERAIRNKYKGRTDQATMQKMNQEIMDAQQKEGVNMFGGCLPMLIQMPIIILLYEVIRNPLLYVAEYSTATINALKNVLFYNGIITNSAITELDMVAVLRDNAAELDFSNVLGMAKHLTDAGAIEDLPNFYMIAGKYVDLSVTPAITFEWPKVLYLLIPVITFVALFFSMKLNRKMTGAATAPATTDENAPDMSMANGIMDLMMPAMSTVITFMVPSVLGVYWIFNNLLSTVQQFILKKMVPFPVFTEEDYKQAEREYNKGKEVKKSKEATEKKAKNPNVKSLHHIDDDDDEDYPELPPMTEGPRKTAEPEKKSKKNKKDKK